MDGESGVIIGNAQRRIEKVPSHPIELPTERGLFEVDEAVVDGEC